MGFSPLGLAISLAVLAPNLILVVAPPRRPLPPVRPAWPLGVLERAGQALCLVVPAITVGGRPSWGWSVPTAAAVVAYYALWARYLRRGRRSETLYAPWWRVPVPMAILPVVAFASGAALLANPWVAGAAAILAAGHIPAASIIARAVRGGTDR
ncbi:hypothetical protein ACTU3I_15110 [Microbacterium sp. RD1]|uniref:hypothetical protein n=1 Tax=Microbacterium sp. RD1 TaxID=3457313 RepID=UPI003FA5FAEB